MQHLQDRQDGHTPDDGLPEMVAAVVSSSAQPHRDCPFCPIAFVDVPTMQKHVRYHLERLAMYALPDVDEQEGGELVSGNSSDSRRPMDNHSDSSRDKFIAIGIDFGTMSARPLFSSKMKQLKQLTLLAQLFRCLVGLFRTTRQYSRNLRMAYVKPHKPERSTSTKCV